jgi:hypothetical protein
MRCLGAIGSDRLIGDSDHIWRLIPTSKIQAGIGCLRRGIEQRREHQLEVDRDVVAGGLSNRILDEGSIAAVELLADDAIREPENEAIGGELDGRDRGECTLPDPIRNLAPEQVGRICP